jgi:RHS repeat-associated protein
LAYNLVDQVTGITQNGSTTSFTYDALGRRVNETAGSLTTVRHYSDSSDNPEWTTQLSAANLTTEIYTGSLGAGLAVTTTFKGTARTSSMQLTDIRGHTVTNLDLDSNSVGAWSVYDSFGNPQTSQTNTNLINYSSYGQQERATTTGLILMGARVYNPATNQFTSKDPIPGGNENSYTYPNDPINGSDFSGLWGWEETFMVLSVAAMFIPVAGQVAMAIQGARLGVILLRGAMLQARAQKMLVLVEAATAKAAASASSKAALRVVLDKKMSKKVVEKVGELFTKSTKREPHGPKLKETKITSEDGSRFYRSPSVKSESGDFQANFQSHNTQGKSNYRVNVHVNVRKWP